MKPGSSRAEPARTTSPPGATRLNRRELFSLVGLGLVLAGITSAIALVSGRSRGRPDPLLETPRTLAEFQLTERSGRPVSRAELAGKFLVVNFVFTSCSVSCLAVNRQMAETQRLLAGDDDVRLISLTVDPRTDTPPVLTTFAARFGADAQRWLFLTGDKATLYSLIETSFLPRDPKPDEAAMPGGFRYTDRIALVDRAGQVRAYFDGMQRATPAAIAATVRRLRAEAPHL